LGVATATDNCSGASAPTFSDQTVPGNCAGNYTVKRTWRSQDGCGNVSTALQTITVQDTTAPIVLAPPNATLPFTGDTSTNNTGVASAQDGCSSVTLSYHDAVTIQSDGTQVITRTWVGTDTCGNSASAVQTITLDSPNAPVLPVQTNRFITDLTTLIVTNTATNPNVPANPLVYQLLNPPAGATIDNNGIITWTPTLAQSPSTNVITTVVTTTVQTLYGSSTVSATNSFIVIVSGPYDGIDLTDPNQALADSDGDGLTNLVEYAVGTDPWDSTDANAGIIVYITQDNGNHYLAMKFKRRTNAAALHLQYLPEVTGDKLTWYSDNTHVLNVSVTPLDAQFDWVIVRDTTPITPAAARFIRLHIISGTIESASPVWIGSDSLIYGNSNGSRVSLFSQRMVRPILSAGTVASLQNALLVDTNAAFANAEFGTNGMPAYVEFDNGAMADIADTVGVTKNLVLAGTLGSLASPGDAYRVRAHFTIASVFGTNNEAGLKAGVTAAQADTISLIIPETQRTMTVFYLSNAFAHGWALADRSALVPDQVIYPEQGVMVRRIAPSDTHVYLCGPVKTGEAIVPVQPGYNLVGTLKSLNSVPLEGLNLYTGDSTTGLFAGQTASAADNLVVVQPNGVIATYFYFDMPGVYQGWADGSRHPAVNVQIPAGSAFFIKRQHPGAFTWTIPAE
jgi:hypothetical protein